LIATGKYVRPTLGVEVDERVNQLITERLNVKGVAVLRVTPGSAAEAAGIRGARIQEEGVVVPGDVILAVDGEPVDGVARLLGRLDERRVGETIRITLLRDGQKVDVNVRLQAGSQ
jgi:S1-C subfamily serine protease